MHRHWKLAAGAVMAAAAAGAYLHWIHDWRPSCSNVPSAAAAAEWLNGLGGQGARGRAFAAAEVACIAHATFYGGGASGFDQRDYYDLIPGIGIHYRNAPRPEDFAKLKDLPRLRSVSFLTIDDAPGFADAVAAEVGRYERLALFDWQMGGGLTDAGLRHLAGLTQLRRLILDRFTLGPAVEVLAKMPDLREIWMRRGTLSAAAIAHLAALRAVEELNFSAAKLEGSLAPIARMPSLRRLRLGGDETDEAQLASLAGAPALEYLRVRTKSAIGAAAFEGLAKIPNLATLVLEDARIAGWLEVLGRARSLRTLTLSNNGLDDRAGAALGALRKLTRLTLDANPVGDMTVAALASLPELEALSLSGTVITDAGADHIARMPALKEVWLDSTKVTAAGLAKLKAAKPGLKVR